MIQLVNYKKVVKTNTISTAVLRYDEYIVSFHVHNILYEK